MDMCMKIWRLIDFSQKRLPWFRKLKRHLMKLGKDSLWSLGLGKSVWLFVHVLGQNPERVLKLSKPFKIYILGIVPIRSAVISCWKTLTIFIKKRDDKVHDPNKYSNILWTVHKITKSCSIIKILYRLAY